MKPLVIIHGWSDVADSFLPLAEAIESLGHRSVEHLFLGNYVSLDDDVQMLDLVRALSKAWSDKRLPTASKSVDVVIHSTGGLVIRDWLETEYVTAGLKPPLNNLVMLAPANFGSPLAHKGRALYGRVLKGFSARKRFQTGTHILNALEMASPYTWHLAQADRFGSNTFSATGVRTTVIVGNTGYGGISSLANEPGSDGTVYVATANLDCAWLAVDFPGSGRNPQLKAARKSKGETAFLVLDGLNHSTVALKGDVDDSDSVLSHIVSALDISNADGFRHWVDVCSEKTRLVMDRYSGSRKDHKHGFQNTVMRVRDDEGFAVTDYVVEFYGEWGVRQNDTMAERVNDEALTKVHAYKGDASYRSFMIDCTNLYKIIDRENKPLRISLSAMPDFNDDKNMVGYCSFGADDIGEIKLSPDAVKELFVPNRTLFIEITLKRRQKEELFRIRNKAEFMEQ
ncbi:MAG: hypothetical protein WDZ76_14215 [Pseudohongiellaceae bacterium]